MHCRSYIHRWYTPFKEAASSSPFFYSFNNGEHIARSACSTCPLASMQSIMHMLLFSLFAYNHHCLVCLPLVQVASTSSR